MWLVVLILAAMAGFVPSSVEASCDAPTRPSAGQLGIDADGLPQDLSYQIGPGLALYCYVAKRPDQTGVVHQQTGNPASDCSLHVPEICSASGGNELVVADESFLFSNITGQTNPPNGTTMITVNGFPAITNSPPTYLMEFSAAIAPSTYGLSTIYDYLNGTKTANPVTITWANGKPTGFTSLNGSVTRILFTSNSVQITGTDEFNNPSVVQIIDVGPGGGYYINNPTTKSMLAFEVAVNPVTRVMADLVSNTGIVISGNAVNHLVQSAAFAGSAAQYSADPRAISVVTNEVAATSSTPLERNLVVSYPTSAKETYRYNGVTGDLLSWVDQSGNSLVQNVDSSSGLLLSQTSRQGNNTAAGTSVRTFVPAYGPNGQPAGGTTTSTTNMPGAASTISTTSTACSGWTGGIPTVCTSSQNGATIESAQINVGSAQVPYVAGVSYRNAVGYQVGTMTAQGNTVTTSSAGVQSTYTFNPLTGAPTSQVTTTGQMSDTVTPTNIVGGIVLAVKDVSSIGGANYTSTASVTPGPLTTQWTSTDWLGQTTTITDTPSNGKTTVSATGVNGAVNLVYTSTSPLQSSSAISGAVGSVPITINETCTESTLGGTMTCLSNGKIGNAPLNDNSSFNN